MSADDSVPHRAGAVALLGPPNVGKSTLLNHLLGQKLVIVTRKPQTTRSRILGIVNRPRAQLLLFDTPGLHEGRRFLDAALNQAVEEAVSGCDVGVLLVDLTRGWHASHDAILASLRKRGVAVIVAGTKHDLPAARRAAWPFEPAKSAVAHHRVSAQSGQGIEGLLASAIAQLPESPPLYPEDALTDRPLRWLAAELVREAVFEELSQELPYSMAVEVVEFDESRSDRVRIRANLLVTRDSQKRIVVGSGGEVVKRIGVLARREIEQLVGARVHLDLWVKIEPRWLANPRRIKALGYS